MRVFFLAALLVVTPAFAAFEHHELGGRSPALCGAYTGLANDVWAISYNVGGLTQLAANEVSFCFSPNPFGLAELSSGAVAVAVPTTAGTVGLLVSKRGSRLYGETAMGASFARRIGDIGIGLSLFYYSVSIHNYGSAGSLGADLGIHAAIMPEMSVGMMIRNVHAPTLGAANEKLPQQFSVGVAFSPTSATRIDVDYLKETGFNPSASVGIEYWAQESVALRCGMSDEPAQLSAGLGLRYSVISLDYAMVRHIDLGWSHQASVTIQW